MMFLMLARHRGQERPSGASLEEKMWFGLGWFGMVQDMAKSKMQIKNSPRASQEADSAETVPTCGGQWLVQEVVANRALWSCHEEIGIRGKISTTQEFGPGPTAGVLWLKHISRE